jgi:hypothetical protein
MMLWSWAHWPRRSRKQDTLEPLAPLGEDPFAALLQITDALAALRTDLRTARHESAHRLAALEMSARRCYREATRRYLGHLEHAPADTLAAWGRTVEGCLMQLAHAHQSLVVPWRDARSGAALAPDAVPALLARGVRTCAAILKWSHLRGCPEPIGVWADLCRLYALAEGRACTRTPLALVPGLDLRSTIEREFLEACMLHAAHPAELRPEQVEIAERAAHFCAPGFALSSAGDPRFPRAASAPRSTRPWWCTPSSTSSAAGCRLFHTLKPAPRTPVRRHRR